MATVPKSSAPWWQHAEVKSRIDNLHPSILDIRRMGTDKSFRFEWVLPEDFEAAIDRVIDKKVNDEVGYAFADFDDERRERWIEVYEQQSSIQSFLNSRFGDPNVLLPYGIKQARLIHKDDPGYVLRQSQLKT